MKVAFIVLGVIIALTVVAWLGLRIQPKSFAAYTKPTSHLDTVPLPAGLPAPVERFYRTVYGDRIPVITSAVVTGRATMRPLGPVTLPARFRFTHEAGKGYRHYIEATFFGIPVMKVNERFVDGRGRYGVAVRDGRRTEDRPGRRPGHVGRVDLVPGDLSHRPARALGAGGRRDGAPRGAVRKRRGALRRALQPEDEPDRLDGVDALPRLAERGKDLVDEQVGGVERAGGQAVPDQGAAIWMDDGKPWATFTVEDIVYNTDVA